MYRNKYSSSTCIFFLFMVANCFPPFANPLHFKINIFDYQSKILLGGDAIISSGAIQLNEEQSFYRAGQIFYSEPLQLWDSHTGAEADFTTRFTFTIISSDGGLADGLVFFLAPLNYQVPLNSAGAYFGLLHKTTSLSPSLNQIVMVEFDTYPNTELGDPPEMHVGIDKNSIKSIVYKDWNASLHIGKPAHVLISYNATLRNLSVSWTYDDQEGESLPSKTSNNTESLSCILDLKEALPERVLIGFSASTGNSGEGNIINSWEFSSNLEATADNITVNGKYNGNKKDREIDKKLLVAIVVGCCFSVGVLIGIVWLLMKKKEKLNSALCSVNIDLERTATTMPKRFSYQELVTATNNFAHERRLGQGGSGQVYKATLNDIAGRIVAVKKIIGESQQSERIFINEVNIISRLIHRNLVKFIGWCHDQNELLLVYEYMLNGSLDAHLFGERKSLPWNVRYKIAQGLASAIHYLHEDAERCVLHRDIKSANVLLDTNFVVKLGDFGVAKLVDSGLRTQTTAVVGTFGYLAPEYFSERRATKESDMYSFGVVALEIACGKRTYYRVSENDHVPLMRWVWELYVEGKIMEAVDERLNMEFDENEMRVLLMVGLWCTHPRKKERPRASQVMRAFQLEAQLPDLDTHDRHISPPSQVSPADSFQTEITSSLRNEGR